MTSISVSNGSPRHWRSFVFALALGFFSLMGGTSSASPSEKAEAKTRLDGLDLPPSDESFFDAELGEDALFGEEIDGPESHREKGLSPDFSEIREDPLAIGGQLYLRLLGAATDRGKIGEQSLSMPNLLDLYLDARPEERVRGFVSLRLRYDPTVKKGSRNLFGQEEEGFQALLDQLWIKTDIAHRVFLTLGQERIKWGVGRLWSPNDFINQRQREPLALFDERVGVPMLKVHVPFETLNFYFLGLLGGAGRWDEPGLAFRFEGAFSSTELALSALYGKGRKTSFGLDVSTALGPLDLTFEANLQDESDSMRYEGRFDLESLTFPEEKKRGKWMGRLAAGLQYSFKPNDDDIMVLGLEYFYQPGGVKERSLYPWLALRGDFQPFYLAQHYLGLMWLVPQPGNWEDTSFSFSTVGNLSDMSFLSRLDVSQVLHTKLVLEAYVQGHYGKRGGEMRFAMKVPDLPPLGELLPEGLEGFEIGAPILSLGLNLRLKF